jgi:Fic family protein
LRRGNRIKTVQASLEIEGNTLNLEQVTAVLAGKRVLGQPREIQEVRNAFVAYEQMTDWSPHTCSDLLTAHGVLMAALADEMAPSQKARASLFLLTKLPSLDSIFQIQNVVLYTELWSTRKSTGQ